MTQEIKAVKGMNDILPLQSNNWLWLEQKLANWLTSYGYNNIRTPIVESTILFKRSIGEVTDIVEKEMYSFQDSYNNDSLTLRPEGTASTLRAVIEHNLLYSGPQKLWYIGPMFRHERPQKGRYRQFHQLGVEALGVKNPYIDSEIILMQYELWKELKIDHLIQLQINCLGELEERLTHKKHLIEYFEKFIDKLQLHEKERLYKNPLRLLDSKNPELQEIIKSAPKLIDYLKDESKEYYSTWKNSLDELQIPYYENPSLVRGLDYYNLSVFEWVTTSLGSQGTIAAGGRYDSLIEQLGGGNYPAIGFALGIERLLLLLEQLNLLPNPNYTDIFIAVQGTLFMNYAIKLSRVLRNNNFNVMQDYSCQSFKAQLKKANILKAKVVLLIGENEVQTNTVIVKFMDEGIQTEVSIDKIIPVIQNYLVNPKSGS